MQKIIYVGPDKLPLSVLEMASLTSPVWKKSASFDRPSIRNQMTTQSIPELVSVVNNEIQIDTTTAYVEATEVKDLIVSSILDLENLVGNAFLQSNGSVA